MEKKKLPWVPTLVAQVCLCFALYLVFQLGQRQKSANGHGSETSALDLHFISVRGGFRPPNQQTHLLKLMVKVAKKYKAKFVVDISDVGNDDPLMQNVRFSFTSHNFSAAKPLFCLFLELIEAIKVPSWNKGPVRILVRTLLGNPAFLITESSLVYHYSFTNWKWILPKEDQVTLREIVRCHWGGYWIITAYLNMKAVTTGSLPGLGNGQLPWLRRTLEATDSNWRIVIGFHPLVICEDGEERTEGMQAFESLQHTFMKFEVNAYLSGQDCNSSARLGSLSYVRNPGRVEVDAYVASANETSAFGREFEDGFLLHRVSSLEMVTYFVSSGGEVVHISVLHQKGKEIM